MKNQSIKFRIVEVLSIGAGIWFWVAFVGMYFTDDYPALKPYVMWTFRLYAALLICFLIGLIIFSICYGARKCYELYLKTIYALQVGIFGRIAVGIIFVVSFIVALFFTRW